MVKNGRKFTVEELSAHLMTITEKEKDHIIPSEPAVHVPEQQHLPHLGTSTEEVDKTKCYNFHEYKK